jgi:acetate kinase
MNSIHSDILALNGGTSSIKFALFASSLSGLERKLSGKIERMGMSGTHLSFTDAPTKQLQTLSISVTDYQSAAHFLFDWFEKRQLFATLGAIGHRVIQGMQHAESELITTELLDELRLMLPFGQEQLRNEIEMIVSLRARYPHLRQVACFDTAFHHEMPLIAKWLPIPRRYLAKGVQRYGFYGLAYISLLAELRQLGDPAATKGRVILAHLGAGSSLAAVLDGKSIDTSMGFTPASGLPMSTRSGDLDPELIAYLAQIEKMTPAQFAHMVNHESGLLGVSELSADMCDLLAAEPDDTRAAEAVALYCYQVKKWIGGFAAALGGLDTLVFSGGIGENAPLIRTHICEGLGFLGIELDAISNQEGIGLISKQGSQVSVRVIRTNEELTIAHATLRFV